MNHRFVALITLAVLLLAALVGQAALAQPTSPPAATAATVIGASLSLTGKYAQSAQYQKQAYELWVKTVNGAGGLVGHAVGLRIYDDQSDPNTAVRLYEKLISEDKVDLVIGPFSSGISAAVSTVVEKHGMPTVMPLAADDEMFARGYKNIFQIITPASRYLDGYWALAKQYGMKTVAFTGEDTAFNQDAIARWKKLAEEAGLRVVAVEFYPPKSTDLSGVLTKIKAQRPDIITGGTYDADSVLLARQCKELNVNPKLFGFTAGPQQAEYVKQLGKDAEYIMGAIHWAAQQKTPGNAEFVRDFKAAYGREPNYHAASAYGGAQVLQRAVEAAKSLDRNAIRTQLATMRTQTIFGPYQAGPGGAKMISGSLVIQIQNGRAEIVWPENVATAKPRLPVPAWSQR